MIQALPGGAGLSVGLVAQRWFAALLVVLPAMVVVTAQEPSPIAAQEVVSAETIAKKLARKTRSAPLKRQTTRGLEVVEVDVVSGATIAFANIRFVINSTEFADNDSARQVQEIAKAILALPKDDRFLIEGHTCDLGTESHNKRLSELRADKVRTLLAEAGVEPERLVALGFGESEAPKGTTDEAIRSMHRKVVIYKCAQ